MIIYHLFAEIPLLLLGITLWILCCRYAKKRSERESWPVSASSTSSVYIIPICEEEREDEEVVDVNEPYSQPPHRDPPMYSSRNISPPPYRLEPPSYTEPPPSYTEPPPSYTEPPAYSEQP